jgi:hypothetical protein
MIVILLFGIGISLLVLMDRMDTIQAGDPVSFISKVTGTRINGHVVRHVDVAADEHHYIVKLRTGQVTVPVRDITKECG